MRRKPTLSVLACLSIVVLSALWGAQLLADEAQFSFDVDGRTRFYRLHVPSSYDGRKAVPLIIVLHGGGGNSANAERMAQMDSRADQQNFIVVYPDGTGRFRKRLLTWNAWNCCGYAVDQGVDDVGFIRELINRLSRQYQIDPKRIFATGLSNGAIMAHRLGCELSDKIAAIAPVAGGLNADSCAPAEPVSVIEFHGTADEHFRYEGGANAKRFPGAKPRVDKSIPDSVAMWVNADGCSPRPTTETKGSVTKEAYRDGKEGAEVVLYSIQGQGHAWPGGIPGVRNGNVDRPTQEISATDLMLKFFFAHPKK